MTEYLKPLHLSISVEDIDASIAWFKKHLDFALVFKMYIPAHQAHLAFVKHGQFEVELIQHDESQPMPPERLNPHEDQRVRGAKHLAFLVEDVDALHDRLKSEGVVISRPPRLMENKEMGVREKICFIQDPNGINFELIQRL